jgi:hypothetical protein
MESLMKKFYPVIHCIDPDEQQGLGHAIANTRIAIENGADGVFLIGHGMYFMNLFFIYHHVRKEFPRIWIGVNFLDISNEKTWAKLTTIASECKNLDALWIDRLPDEKLLLPQTLQVFGGVAFKYIDPHQSGEDLEIACKKAMKCVDVAVTSGNRTGSAPDISKLKSIRKNLGENFPFALASGISSTNVSMFLEYVDICIVASSICKRISNLDNTEYLVPERVRDMATLIHR